MRARRAASPRSAVAAAALLALGTVALPGHAAEGLAPGIAPGIEPGTDPRTDQGTDRTTDEALAYGTLSDEAWFDTIRLSARPDQDRDGFASGLDLTLDADTTLRDGIEVYARLSLSGGDGVERLLYDTSTFRLRGRITHDELTVGLDLIEAFPADRYDLIVELRSAYGDRLLDVVDRGDFHNLGGVALEDAYRDGRYRDDDPYGGTVSGGYVAGYSSNGHDSSSYVAVDYTGANGPLGVALLGGLTVLRWRRRRAL